ncbi:MAG TPA: ABC transporter substrate-binding protein [Stellaceae bacterium]|jgi:ABC-type nitrate/sulfonate/bicarbonate transport system substrate-binding protein|nr:ABC transporter substrate-binding protein [Stellaceae bacterium]
MGGPLKTTLWLGRLALAMLALGALALPAAAQKLRVGNPAARNFLFVPFYVATQTGIFAKYGIDVEPVDFQGGAKVQQAMVAGAIDLSVSGATDMAFIAKGAPELAVAAEVGAPLNFGLITSYDSPIHDPADLKGRKIGVTSVGSLTQWLVLRLMHQNHWAADDVTFATTGGDPASQIAALVTGQVDGIMTSSALGLQLELSKRGRLAFPASKIIPNFISAAIFASNRILHDNPHAVRQFLAAWFDTIGFMRANKAQTVKIAMSVTGFVPEVEDGEYDLVMPTFSTDGKFDPAPIEILQGSFIEMGLLGTKPDMSKLYTEAYLPSR